MHYHIDTIPVLEALEAGGECLLCNVEKKTDQLYVENFLGGSVMSPDTRVQVNEHGFCPTHFKKLYEEKNRLGLALLTHTYMRETTRQLDAKFKSLPKAKEKNKLFGDKKSPEYVQYEALLNWLSQKEQDCMICKKVDAAMARYTYTMLYLFRTSNEFKSQFESSSGLCLHHIQLSIRIALEQFGTAGCGEWLKSVLPIVLQSLERLDGELDWFIKKFDYRYRQEPWGTSEDSLVRSLQKLVGEKFD